MIAKNTIAAFALACAALPGPALAHAHLVSADPSENAILSAPPAALKLTFSEDLEIPFSGVAVTGPGNAALQTGTATLAADDKTLIVPLPHGLDPGLYTVTWHALSQDGHTTHAAFSFTIKP